MARKSKSLLTKWTTSNTSDCERQRADELAKASQRPHVDANEPLLCRRSCQLFLDFRASNHARDLLNPRSTPLIHHSNKSTMDKESESDEKDAISCQTLAPRLQVGVVLNSRHRNEETKGEKEGREGVHDFEGPSSSSSPIRHSFWIFPNPFIFLLKGESAPLSSDTQSESSFVV